MAVRAAVHVWIPPTFGEFSDPSAPRIVGNIGMAPFPAAARQARHPGTNLPIPIGVPADKKKLVKEMPPP